MHWIAPSGKNANNAALEKRLWDATDQLRANSELKSQEYSAPVLGLIFLRFAEVRFTARRAALEKDAANGGTSSLPRRGSRLDEQALALQRQIQNLRRTRDLLLPRLLSGQILLGG